MTEQLSKLLEKYGDMSMEQIMQTLDETADKLRIAKEALFLAEMRFKTIDSKLKHDHYLIDDNDDGAVRTLIKRELKRINQALTKINGA